MGDRCRTCDEALPPRARFCPGCGQPVPGGPGGPGGPGVPGAPAGPGAAPPPQPPRPPVLPPVAAPAGSAPGTMAVPGARPSETVTDPRQRMLPPRLIAPGTRIGARYEIDGVLGEGGMGVVYRATDLERGRTVAIKALHASLMGDAGIRRRFTREAQLMLGWKHRNVARVDDFLEQPDLLAFVMEFVDGPTLEEYLQRWSGKLPYDDIRAIFTGVLAAMEEAHSIGIVHRDLKPHNILLRVDDDGVTPKVVDFGIAKILEGTTYTMTGAMLGTCRYMSPEQVQAPQDVDHRSDIYSLGVTLYRCLTGRCPFEGNSHFAVMMAHVEQAPEPPSAFRPHLPPPLERIVLAALAKDRAARPQSCGELRAALEAALVDVTASRAERDAEQPRVIIEDDGNEMRIVPGGPFPLGAHRRTVHVDRFHLARYPVTNRQFQAFVDATGYRPADAEAHRFLAHFQRGRCPPELADHPVVFVSWTDARAYCRWAARRLPSEAEWEKAARGPEGNKYPWGREEPTPELANYGQARAKVYPVPVGAGGTSPVTAFPLSAGPYGHEGLAGNVFEWCEDVDDPGFYLHGPDRNPRNTIQPGAAPHVIRGGSWRYDASSLRSYARASFPPTFRLDTVGFRVAL